MYEAQEDVFYYLTVGNEQYEMPAMPTGVEEGILRGLYRFCTAPEGKAGRRAHLLASGAILNQALAAQTLLAERYGVAADVWSLTSFKELHRDGHATERWNRHHPGEPPKTGYLEGLLQGEEGAFVVASDYVRALPDSVSRWFPRPPVVLGTDGFGRSDSREALRDFFEVDGRFITLAALTGLAREGRLEWKQVRRAMKDLEIDPGKADPVLV
jgi:pyruvate dehydrogenase E1 component